MLFKYNNTHVWGKQLTSDQLRLYMRVARKEGAAMAKREGNKRQRLARNFHVCGEERHKRLEEAEKKAAEKAAEIARLHDRTLRVVTFSGLTKLQSKGLKEQLRLRSVRSISAARTTAERWCWCRPRVKAGAVGSCSSSSRS